MRTSSSLPTYDALKRRLLGHLVYDRGVPVREVEYAMWRQKAHGSPIPDPEEMAPHVLALVEACVHEHLDVRRLSRDVAALIRESQPVRWGVCELEAYERYGEGVVRDYVHPAPPPPPPSFLLQF